MNRSSRTVDHRDDINGSFKDSRRSQIKILSDKKFSELIRKTLHYSIWKSSVEEP